jgi:acetyl-CoA carboxylase biotin carboxyl carrier protein
MDLTNEDVADILALLDSLPYDELDLQTPRFRLTLRRTPDGWTQSTQVLAASGAPEAGIGARGPQAPPIGARGPQAPLGDGAAGAEEVGGAQRDSGEGEVESAAGRSSTRGAEGDGGAGGVADGAEGDSEGAGKVGEGAGKVGEGAGKVGEGAGEVTEGELAGELADVRAPLPGTFYRAPRPGAEPFVEVGSRVGADTVVAIVETMKLMNSVHAGADGTVAEICLANGEFTEHGATLLRIRADP